MTDVDVQRVVESCAARGIRVHSGDVQTLLRAKAILAAEPNSRLAQSVVEEYSRLLTAGVQPTTFARFMLPELNMTDEEFAAAIAKRTAQGQPVAS